MLDADGVRLGIVDGPVAGDEGVAPHWLGLELDGAGAEVVPVPAAGAEPTGSAVRVATLEQAVRSAPPGPLGRPLTAAEDSALAAHYAAARPGSGGHPQAPVTDGSPPPTLGPAAKQQIVARLREAYALEGEGILRLEALIKTVQDPEVRHGATLHKNETRLHRTGVEERLKALDAAPSTSRDAARAARATAAGLRARLRGDPTAAVRDAEAFERREAGFYASLEELARRLGDTATVDLAVSLRADELAQADSLAGCIPRLDSPV